MDLENEFRVAVPIDKTWNALTDLEFIAPCMPGAQLTEVEGDDYRGIVKIKVGPISAQYNGTARITEKDDVAHKAVLRAEGRDSKGSGNASADVTAVLTADGDVTIVHITTTLAITGKVAQFGRGLMGDVTGKLLGQFAKSLEERIIAQG